MGLSTNGEEAKTVNMVEDTMKETAVLQVPPLTCVLFNDQLKDEGKDDVPADGLGGALKVHYSEQEPSPTYIQSNQQLEDEARKMHLENGLASVPKEIRTYFRFLKPLCKCGNPNTKFLRFNNPTHCKHIQPWYSCNNADCKPFRLFSRYKQDDVNDWVEKKKPKKKRVCGKDENWASDSTHEDHVNIPTPLLTRNRVRWLPKKDDNMFPSHPKCEEYQMQYSNMDMSTMNPNNMGNQVHCSFPNIHTQMIGNPYQHQMVATLNQQHPNNNNYNSNNHLYVVQPLNQNFSNFGYNNNATVHNPEHIGNFSNYFNTMPQQMFQTFMQGNGNTVMSIGDTLEQKGINGGVISSLPQSLQYSSHPNQGPQVNNFQVKQEADNSNNQQLAQNSTAAVIDGEYPDLSITNSLLPDLPTGSYHSTIYN